LSTSCVDAVEVVCNRDRAEDEGKVPGFAADATLLGLVGLLVLDGRVGAGEVDLAGDELGATVARTAGVVSDVDRLALFLAYGDVGGDELVHGVLLCRGTSGREVALAFARCVRCGRVHTRRRRVVVAATCGQGHGAHGHYTEQGTTALEIHQDPPEIATATPTIGRRHETQND